MLKIKVYSLALLGGLMIASTANAGDWNGEGGLGFTSTSGNTDSSTLSARLSLGKEHGNWVHNTRLDLLKSSSSGVDSADRIVFIQKSQYNFAEKTFTFGRLRHEEDKFSGFNHQTIVSIGVGHVFINGVKHNLEASAGAGYKDLETNLGEDNQEAVFDGEFKYAYKISETSEFNQNFLVESGSSNTYGKSETFLKLVIVGNLGAKLGYEVTHNTDVPVGTENTDTITTVTLVYSF